MRFVQSRTTTSSVRPRLVVQSLDYMPLGGCIDLSSEGILLSAVVLGRLEGGEKPMGTKKPYTSPQLKKWGTVADLTKTGQTNPGPDTKAGSSSSQGG
jgi:hypothetical protein